MIRKFFAAAALALMVTGAATGTAWAESGRDSITQDRDNAVDHNQPQEHADPEPAKPEPLKDDATDSEKNAHLTAEIAHQSWEARKNAREEAAKPKPSTHREGGQVDPCYANAFPQCDHSDAQRDGGSGR